MIDDDDYDLDWPWFDEDDPDERAIAVRNRQRALQGAGLDVLVRVRNDQLDAVHRCGCSDFALRFVDSELKRRGFRAYHAVEVPEPRQLMQGRR